LNVAAPVLSCLFQAFPDSAKQLKEDRGLFHGSRPGVFDKVSRSRLRELVLNRNGIARCPDARCWSGCIATGS
jgi:hypothetical protein